MDTGCVVLILIIYLPHHHISSSYYRHSMASQQAMELGTAQEQKEQRDNLHWKKFLPEADFYQEFKNTQLSHKTVLCFGLNRAGNELWDYWGYTFNIPGGDHAEKQVMKALSDLLTPHRLCLALRYRLTLYLSYSPCEDCCCELLAFVKSLKVVEVDVMVSRLYCTEEHAVRNRLQLLMASGIRLSVMGRKDFEQCLRLFVDYNSKFKAWPELDAMSRRYSMDLHTILHEVSLSLIGSCSIFVATVYFCFYIHVP